jgi:hypothetical protein
VILVNLLFLPFFFLPFLSFFAYFILCVFKFVIASFVYCLFSHLLGHTIARVNGILGVARAFGDFELEDYITCVPDVFRLPIAEMEAGHILIAACDGLWDVMEDSAVCVPSREVFLFLHFLSFSILFYYRLFVRILFCIFVLIPRL